MKTFSLAASFLLLLSSFFTTTTTQAQLSDSLSFDWNDVNLPIPLSDMMANTMIVEGGKEVIIITGGCNDPLGNQRNETEALDLFYCTSTSTATWKFDPVANTFTAMAEAPVGRYRHAATEYNGELYVLGGRDANDDLVTEIASFNPTLNKWTNRGNLPDDLVTSDLTAWTYDDFIYVTGGFYYNYTAVGTTYRLNVGLEPSSFGDMQMELLDSLAVPRGDFHAIVLFGYAYVAGGLTDTNLWCVGMVETERYSLQDNKWETVAPLTHGRADMAVALLNNKIVAMGGETKPERCAELADPAFGSIPESHVEAYVPSEAKWLNFGNIRDERFRFAAATIPSLNRIYHFGGQLPFDFDCQCFKTSASVGVVQEEFAESGGLSQQAIIGIIVGGVVGLFLGAILVWSCLRRAGGQKEAVTAEQRAAAVREGANYKPGESA